MEGDVRHVCRFPAVSRQLHRSSRLRTSQIAPTIRPCGRRDAAPTTLRWRRTRNSLRSPIDAFDRFVERSPQRQRRNAGTGLRRKRASDYRSWTQWLGEDDSRTNASPPMPPKGLVQDDPVSAPKPTASNTPVSRQRSRIGSGGDARCWRCDTRPRFIGFACRVCRVSVRQCQHETNLCRSSTCCCG